MWPPSTRPPWVPRLPTRPARSAGATDLEPGAYDVILEEYAVQTILEYLAYAGFSALAVEEGRSFMDLGNRVMGDNVSIWDDGNDPSGLPAAADFEGVAKQRVDLVTDGVATAVVHDSATARRAGVASTGHALPAPNTFGPMTWNLFMAPGSSSKEAMLSSIERGIWVTRFHYVNIVHPRKAVLTGMTKDGTFLIENGRIVRPIRNLRFTEEIPAAFSRIEAINDSDQDGRRRVQRHQRPRSRPAHRPLRLHWRDRCRVGSVILSAVELHVGDLISLRKEHPCGSREWRVQRIGADIGLVCAGCGHRVLMDRLDVERRYTGHREHGLEADG